MKNIYQRIAAIREAVAYIKKDTVIQIKNGRGYSAITHDAVAAALREPMAAEGVVTIPRVTSHERIETSSGNGAFIEKVNVEVEFINVDDPEDKFVVPSFAFGMDYGDKAPGKAISMAIKYTYLKTFNIESGDSEESRVAPPPKPVAEEKAADLDSLVDEVGADREGFLKYFGIKKIEEMPAKRFNEAVKMLETKRG